MDIRALLGMCLIVACLPAMAAPPASKTLYRYVNQQGNTVVDSIIPAEYVAGGYEVITTNGKLVRVVAPALSKEAAAAQAKALADQEQRKKDDLLLRRSYSSVEDIDAAKVRNLQMLKSNIVIIENNLESARKRLETAKSQAASIERSGKDAPEALLKSIAGFEQEERDLVALIDTRQAEIAGIDLKYEQDKKRFVELMSQMKTPAQ